MESNHILGPDFIGCIPAEKNMIRKCILSAVAYAESSDTWKDRIKENACIKSVVLYETPRRLANSLSLPESSPIGTIIARSDIETGTIFLTRLYLDGMTIAYEVARVLFQDTSGMQSGSRLCRDFADDFIFGDRF